MPRKKKVVATEIQPIPSGKRAAWDALIEKSRSIVESLNKSQFELVFIADEVQKKYGEGTVERWAEEIGISYRLARQYKYLAEKKVDRAFVRKWASLSYSLIYEVLAFCGGINDTSNHFLEHAKKHNLSVRANAAYMRDYFAPPMQKDEAQKDYKLMLKEKQELEGFSDVVLHELEKVAEEHPEFLPAITSNAITDAEALTALKQAAGVLTAEEAKLVAEARTHERKFHSMYRYLRNNETEVWNTIIYGHEVSGVLRERLLMIHKVVSMLIEAHPNEMAIIEDNSIEIDVKELK